MISKLIHQEIKDIKFRHKIFDHKLVWQKYYNIINTHFNVVTNKDKKKSRLQQVISLLPPIKLKKALMILDLELIKETQKQPQHIRLGNKRYHVTDKGIYPGVTTVLSATKDKYVKKAIDKWKENLVVEYGQEKAEAKMAEATTVGDEMHLALSGYLVNAAQSSTFLKENKLAYQLMPFLEQIAVVYGVELPIYSCRWGFAGTLDCLARLKDGRIAVIDFKSSQKMRNRSYCKDYSLQCAAYALAVHEMWRIKCDCVIVAMSYWKTVGKRNPRVYDVFEFDNLRELSLNWLERLKEFNFIYDTEEDYEF